MRIKLKYLVVLILLSNCSIDKKETEEIISEKRTSPSIDIAKSYIDILMESDTIHNNSESGKILFYYHLNDTIKRNKKDRRNVYLALKIRPHKENKNVAQKDFLYEKELDFSPLNVGDTLIIPFNIEPSFKGKATIFGVINDAYFLNSYSTNDGKVRFTSFQNKFEKNVYIK
jgi:hypothetical protein